MGKIFNSSHELFVLFPSNQFPLKQENMYLVLLIPPFGTRAGVQTVHLRSWGWSVA